METPLEPPPHGVVPPAFRLPDTTTLGPVRLLVSDLDRSIDYYQDVLGLRAERTPDGGADLRAGTDGRPLVILSTRPGVKPARRGAFGLYHFAILLPDRAALGRFAAHLFAKGVRAGMADHLVSEALYLSDPDGLGIEVYVDRPRDSWQYQDREFAMTTDPLDISSVIDAGQGRPWDGMPGGTTMGHVHLHVGDLAQAEAFYHRVLGFDKTVWSYPGALFMSAGGYHHHLGTNVWAPGPAPSPDQARLLTWEMILPRAEDVAAAARSLRAAGHDVAGSGDERRVADAWGTELRLRVRA